VQVSRWGNSLAVRLPAAVVDAMGLKEGDQIEVRIAGAREFEISPDRSREQALEPSNHAAIYPCKEVLRIFRSNRIWLRKDKRSRGDRTNGERIRSGCKRGAPLLRRLACVHP